MKTAIKYLFPAFLLCLSFSGAYAQIPVQEGKGIPDELYYLMPDFSDGTIYFRGQSPARGKLNICAVDNSLRYLDKDGTELSASQSENIFKVWIDTVIFYRYQDVFYRLFPVTSDLGVALRRDVHILKDAKQGAYGTVSQTNAIKEYGVIYADGVAYNLNSAKQYPYRVYETLYFFKGDEIYPVNKKGLRKMFPDKKAEIDAWFKDGGALPETGDGLKELIAGWSR